MALKSLPGGLLMPLGPLASANVDAVSTSSLTIAAAKSAVIMYGRVVTSDEGSHTIDTTGSSSIGWMASSVTNSNAGTTVNIGIAAIDTANGPPGRASNTTDVINFDVASVKSGAGALSSGWNESVPTTGTKTIAHGDIVAVCIQMTALGGADSVTIAACATLTAMHSPGMTTQSGSSYTASATLPNCIITFSDGAKGYIHGCEILKTTSQRSYSSAFNPNEYGQLYNLPFSCKVYGIWGLMTPSAADLILYSDPLGTPVAERTVAMPAKAFAGFAKRRFNLLFSSPYSLRPNQSIAVVAKPGASNISLDYKTLDNAAHRLADPFGTSGYGVKRGGGSGAFADANSSLDHYYLGPIIGGAENPARPSLMLGI